MSTRITYALVTSGVLALLAEISPRASIGLPMVNTGRPAPARLSDEVRARPEGRDASYFNLSVGRGLITAYVGEERLVDALLTNQAKPLSLASADFDEDGVTDLVAGYESPGGEGIVVVHRGNVDAIYPNAPGARQRRA